MRRTILLIGSLLLNACSSAPPSPGASVAPHGCARVAGVIDTMHWAPDEQSLVLAVTRPDGNGEINRLDATRLSIERLQEDLLVGPGAIDAGDGGEVYFGRLGDPSVLFIDGSNVDVLLTPPFEVWSHLAWSRLRLVLVNDAQSEAIVTAIQTEDHVGDAIYTTQDRIDSVWTDVDGRATVVAHAPYPEVDPDAGSTLTLIHGDQARDMPLGRLNVAVTASLSPDQSLISFVESNTHRLGALRISDGSIEWIATDVDGAEISPGGILATFNRTVDPAADEVCIR